MSAIIDIQSEMKSKVDDLEEPFYEVNLGAFSIALGCFKRVKNFKLKRFAEKPSNYYFLGQKHFRNVKIMKKY